MITSDCCRRSALQSLLRFFPCFSFFIWERLNWTKQGCAIRHLSLISHLNYTSRFRQASVQECVFEEMHNSNPTWQTLITIFFPNLKKKNICKNKYFQLMINLGLHRTMVVAAVKKFYSAIIRIVRDCCKLSIKGIMSYRDGVLEASASARGGLETVFLVGSASPRPLTVLPRSRPYCLGLGSAS